MTPQEVARDHVARPDRVLRRVDRNAVVEVSLDALAVGGQSDHVVEHGVSGRGGTRDQNPVAGVRGNGISPGRVGSADHVTGGVLDQDAVAAVAGVARAQQVSAAGRQADQVGPDDGPGRDRSDDMNAVAAIAGDHVGRRVTGPADGVARSVHQHALCAVADLVIAAVAGRTDHADLVALDDVAGCRGIDPYSLLQVAGDHIVFLGIGAADGRVVGVDVNALLRIPRPASSIAFRPDRLAPVEGSTG